DLVYRVENLRASGVRVLLPDLSKLLDHDPVNEFRRGQNLFQADDEELQLPQVIDNLLPFEVRQALQLQLKNRLRLDLAHSELRNEAHTSLVARLRSADEGDDLVEMIEGDHVSREDVRLFLGLAQLVGRPPTNHLPPEI